MNGLDDLKYIHQKDAQDALGVVEKQWQQLKHAFNVDLAGIDKHKIKNIVWAGMGGSAIPAQLSLSWPTHPLPFEICRNYNIPRYVAADTLFICSSYSGNTEETLSALDEAEAAKAQIIIITAGGELAKRAKKANYPHYLIPAGIQPRMCTWYFLRVICEMYDQLGLGSNLVAELESIKDHISNAVVNWRADKAVASNPAKALALELMGKSVVVYGGPKMQSVANKFKIALNENAKNIAWWNQFPEFNHNEFIGWSSHPIDKPYVIVDVRSKLEHPSIQKRFSLSQKLLSGKRPSPLVIEPLGETLLEQILWGMNFCDFVSIYVALLNGLNPSPVDLVEKFKIELEKV